MRVWREGGGFGCVPKRSTELAGAEIRGGNSQYERELISKIIHFLGLDVPKETVAVPSPESGI